MAELFDVAFDFFVLWLLYKLVFGLIIPVYHSAKTLRKNMSDAQQRMQEQYQQQQSHFRQEPVKPPAASLKPNESDYIDYEEVK
ncbi:MAG: hypothetical protein ACYCOO_00035 [Chitinophagaceae bacterium]